jgi:hypothetical protein
LVQTPDSTSGNKPTQVPEVENGPGAFPVLGLLIFGFIWVLLITTEPGQDIFRFGPWPQIYLYSTSKRHDSEEFDLFTWTVGLPSKKQKQKHGQSVKASSTWKPLSAACSFCHCVFGFDRVVRLINDSWTSTKDRPQMVKSLQLPPELLVWTMQRDLSRYSTLAVG